MIGRAQPISGSKMAKVELSFFRVVGRAWMSGVSIEETLELWAASLRDAKARPLFTQAQVAASAGLFLDGLLEEERRKTG